MFIFTFGDLVGVIALLAVICYAIYLGLWSAKDDYEKRKPYHTNESKTEPIAEKKEEREKVVEKTEKTPLTWRSWLAIILVLAFLASPLLLLVVK